MVDIVKTDVLAIAPELSTVVDAAWTDILAYVNQVVLTECDSDIDRRLARIFLAAHLGTVSKRGVTGAAGPLTSESAGGVKRSYAPPSSTDVSSMSSTRYGLQYIDILGASLVHGPMVV